MYLALPRIGKRLLFRIYKSLITATTNNILLRKTGWFTMLNCVLSDDLFFRLSQAQDFLDNVPPSKDPPLPSKSEVMFKKGNTKLDC